MDERRSELSGGPPTGSWAAWATSLWKAAEGAWISRTGQDHFYRQHVILPAIASACEDAVSTLGTLADLGAGDGHMTESLARFLSLQGAELEKVILVDRSTRQLDVAATRDYGTSIETIVADLSTAHFSLPMPPASTRAGTLYSAIFVIQELATLDPFLSGVARSMTSADLACFVTVHPDYSDHLRETGRITVVGRPDARQDWTWAGGYPVPTSSEVLLLPHFQRSESHYRTAIKTAGLELVMWRELAVPRTSESEHIFGQTVYGEEILNRPSALLMSVKRSSSEDSRASTRRHGD